MAKISTADIKKLRQETGARVMDCKKALEGADGDFDKAKTLIKAQEMVRAEKTADRETKAGFVGSYVHNNGMVASMVELVCETDFVAQNEEFRGLARDIAMHVTAMGATDLEDLLSQDFVKDPSKKIEILVKALSGKIGEKMELKKFVRFEVGQE